jgi:hypothetical protein
MVFQLKQHRDDVCTRAGAATGTGERVCTSDMFQLKPRRDSV